MAVNKVILVGNVGKDPEVRYLDENTPVCKFSLATSEVYKNRNGERVEQTEWHNIVLWRGLAQVAENYVKKGSQLYIEGRIKSRSYDDKDGVKRYITEIVGDTMQMLGKRSEGDGQGSPNTGGYQQAQAAPQAAAPQAPAGSPAPGAQTTPPVNNPDANPGGSTPGGDNAAGGPPQANEADDLPF